MPNAAENPHHRSRLALAWGALLLGAACVAPVAPARGAASATPDRAFAGRPGDPRAWALLARADAWCEQLRRDDSAYWIEATMDMPCESGSGGVVHQFIRAARARDGRMCLEVERAPGPVGLRVRYDGQRTVEHSLASGDWLVFQGSPALPHTSLGGQVVSFLNNLVLGMLVSPDAFDPRRPASRMGPEDLDVGGGTRRCERVRVAARPGDERSGDDIYWLDRETGQPWRIAVTDSTGRVPADAQGLRYRSASLAMPPDSLFETMLPDDARVVLDLDSARPAITSDPTGAPTATPDHRVTFRWRGEARSVAVVGTFNCWDAHADLMRRGADGTWTLTRPLGKTGFQDYLFLVDGTRWINDPLNPACRGDGFGGWVSVVRDTAAWSQPAGPAGR